MHEILCTVAQRPDTHGYSTSRGIPRLRRAISRWYQDRYDVEIDPESEAIVTIGSKEGLAHLMLATLDHGDTVLVPNPSYPIHIYGAVIAGAQVRSVPLVEGVDFFNELERAIRESYPKPKMMILGFPSNPTAECRVKWSNHACPGAGPQYIIFRRYAAESHRPGYPC